MAEPKPNIIEQLVIVKNNSLTETKLCQFFYKTSNWYNDPELEITTSGSEYLEFCRGVISEAYNITCISIVSDSKEQCQNVFNIHYKEAHGQEDVITLAPVLDPYQLVSQIDAYQIPKIEFNGLNALNYYVLPNTKVSIYFQLDKSQTITEAFKFNSGYKDFNKQIIKELVLDEKEKEKCDCDDKEQKNYPERILLKHVAKTKPVINIEIPDIPCRQDPNILEYPIKLYNTGTSNITLDLFRRTTLMYNAYQFVLPYSATYSSGFYFEVTTDQGVFRYDATSTITRDQLVIELNNLGIGTWKLSDSLDENSYTCLSLTHTLSGLFYDSGVVVLPSWHTLTSPTTETILSLFFLDANTGWIVGNNQIIYKTTNGGTSWTAQTGGVGTNYTNVKFLDANTGWIVGIGGIILNTTDGGDTWIQQTSPLPYDLYGITIIDANTAFVVGEFGSDSYLKTTNGGSVWSDISFGTLIDDFLGYFINYISPSTIISIGKDQHGVSNILYSTDDGSSWTYNSDSVTALNYRSFAVSLSSIFITGIDGIYKTSDQGVSYTKMLGSLDTFNSVNMINSSLGWACSIAGAIYKTTDGDNLVDDVSGTTEILTHIQMISSSLGYCVGANGTILKYY